MVDPDRLPESIRQVIRPRLKVTARNAPERSSSTLSFGEKIAATRFEGVRQLDEKAPARLAKLRLDMNITDREYFRKYQLMRFQKDAANKIAGLLTSFQQEHPLEWEYCDWKNFAIAKLVLGKLASSPDTAKSRRAAAERWLKGYWKREQKIARETDTYLSPTRMAASAAVFELEMLELADDLSPWLRPSYGDYTAFVRWLNKNWPKLAEKKHGAALLEAIAAKFRRERPTTSLGDDDLAEVQDAYRRISLSFSEGAVPPSAVVLTLVSRRHNVSPRVVNKVRAETNRHRVSPSSPRKAR
jgi:hypothetical protein